MSGNAWNIIDNIRTTLEDIKVSNGYTTDVAKVYVGKKDKYEIPQTELPAIIVIPGSEDSEEMIGNMATDYGMIVTLDIFMAGSIPEAILQGLLNLIEDIKRVLFNDLTRGGEAYNTDHTKTYKPKNWQLETKQASIRCEFTIYYRQIYLPPSP